MKKDSSFKDNSNIRLNKYIASSGICSRRKADEFIAKGLIKVNNKTVLELGYQVSKNDKVQYKNKIIKPATEFIYIALNKPKDYISTKKDEMERKTIYTLLNNNDRNIVNSVGRLDRNTTGIILFTNDGDLAHKLTHPSSNIIKEYRVVLDRPMSEDEYLKLKDGVIIDDEKFKLAKFKFNTDYSNDVSISIHYGKNRIVRRIFESLNFEVKTLDRLSFAGISKKGILKGKYRYLSTKEVLMLKNKG
jgi:23S rRNA pseudouridine2605 synthase